MFNLFKSRSSGIDIGEESIKFVELLKIKGGFVLQKYAEEKIPKNIIESDKIKDDEEIRKFLLSLQKKHKFKSAYVPFSTEHKGEILAKVLIKNGDKRNFMIISLEGKTADIFIVSNNNLKLAHSFRIDELTLDLLSKELMKHFINWHIRKDEKNLPIKKVILCGDVPDLPRISEFLSLNMKMNVELADVWINILDAEKMIPEMSLEESFKFASALGAALKGFE